MGLPLGQDRTNTRVTPRLARRHSCTLPIVVANCFKPSLDVCPTEADRPAVRKHDSLCRFLHRESGWPEWPVVEATNLCIRNSCTVAPRECPCLHRSRNQSTLSTTSVLTPE